MNNWLNKLERKYGRFGIPNLTNILVAGQILVFAIELFIDRTITAWVGLNRFFLLQGQIWRAITFVFIPFSGGSILSVVLGIYFTWFVGTALEKEWGDFRYTLYFLLGMVFFLLLLLLFLSLVSYRPFCKYLCPLGAVYGLFNPVSCLRLEVKKERCTDCGACEAVCPMSLNPAENPGSPECIRCGKCISACKFGALSQTVLPGGLQFRKKKEQGAQNLRKEP